jgi:hypothetical protein
VWVVVNGEDFKFFWLWGFVRNLGLYLDGDEEFGYGFGEFEVKIDVYEEFG